MTVSCIWDMLIEMIPSQSLGRKAQKKERLEMYKGKYPLKIITIFCKMCSWELGCWFSLRDSGQISILIWIYLSSSWLRCQHIFLEDNKNVWLSSASHYPCPHPHVCVLGHLVSSSELLCTHSPLFTHAHIFFLSIPG